MATAASWVLDEPAFEEVTIAALDVMPPAALNDLSFGVIGMDQDGITDRYNATESRLAGLSVDRVIGRHFFSTVAQCMNNFMIAQRFDDEAELDTVVPYILTLRMKPTPVQLRLLQTAASPRRYVLLQR